LSSRRLKERKDEKKKKKNMRSETKWGKDVRQDGLDEGESDGFALFNEHVVQRKVVLSSGRLEIARREVGKRRGGRRKERWRRD
jgi:hypothetical protein